MLKSKPIGLNWPNFPYLSNVQIFIYLLKTVQLLAYYLSRNIWQLFEPSIFHSQLFTSAIHFLTATSCLPLLLALNGWPLKIEFRNLLMAVSLNSVISFNPTGNYQQVTRSNTRASIPKTISFLRGSVRPRQFIEAKSPLHYPTAASSGNIVKETTDEDAKTIEGSFSNDANISNINPPVLDKKTEPTVETSNDPTIPNQESKTRMSEKRAPLTARERLRAARVLSRYTEAKPPSTPALGSKLLESLRETDKGKKRPSLPEAPTNLLDDSKRGLSKGGWTVDLSSGMDVIVIVFSFVFISTLMFATTYFVWKVGAIHFNEN